MESPFRPDDLTPDFRVIETFGWDGARFPRLDRHIMRAHATCLELGLPFSATAFRNALPRLHAPTRVRVTIDREGVLEVSASPLPPVPAVWHVALARERLRSSDPWLRVKTSRRELYDAVRADLPQGVEEMLFINEREELCEGTITNLFFDLGHGLRTPPVRSGLLPGVLRAELLADGCREAVLRADDLPRARLWVGNSLRGLMPAVLRL